MFDANEIMCQTDRKSISWNNWSFFDSIFDSTQQTIISDKTFSIIWKHLLQYISHQKDELILSYWNKALQYMDLHISHMHHQCLYDHKATTPEDREKRYAERKKFQELHYALGGLLMMLQKYSLLCRLTSWSNQTPPQNRLVPESMEDLIEILNGYCKQKRRCGFILF